MQLCQRPVLLIAPRSAACMLVRSLILAFTFHAMCKLENGSSGSTVLTQHAARPTSVIFTGRFVRRRKTPFAADCVVSDARIALLEALRVGNLVGN